MRSVHVFGIRFTTSASYKNRTLVAMFCFGSVFTSAQQRPEKIILNIEGLYTFDLKEARQFYALVYKSSFNDRNSEDFDEKFVIRKVDLANYYTRTDTTKEHSLYHQVESEKVHRDSILYFLSGFPLREESINGRRFNYRQLFPGESLLVSVPGVHGRHHFYATGRVISSKDSSSLEVFESITNYRLAVRTQNDNEFVDQTIIKCDLRRWSTGDYLGGIFLNWMGDLDRDGELDIIITSSSHHECFTIHVFSFNKKGLVYEKWKENICG